MKVVLFKVRKCNVWTLLISWVTRCRYTHAGLLIGKCVYEATEEKGRVVSSRTLDHWRRRGVLVFDLPDPKGKGEALAKALVGTKYDWVGIWGWFVGAQDKRRFYCFEYVAKIMSSVGYLVPTEGRVTGCDLMKYLGEPEFSGYAVSYKGA